MPFNGSGSFSPPGADFPAVPSTLIESSKFNNIINDIATGLSTAICKDGQTTITANLPMAGFRHTGVGAALTTGQYARYDEIVSGALIAAGLARVNRATNGDFMVVSRGTSFTSATTPANNDDTYLIDQWILLSDGNDIVDVSRETTTIPTGGLFACALDVETANKKFGILHPIEQRNCIGLIGNTCTLSFKARKGGSNATVGTMRAAIIAWDGTADTVTSDVVSAWNASGTNPTLVANWTYENTPADLTLTTSFQTFSVSAAIDTASTKNIGLFLYYNNADGTVADFIYIADVQIEQGTAATAFEQVSIPEKIMRCRRYLPAWIAEGTADMLGTGQNLTTTDSRIVLPLQVETRVKVTGIVASSAAHFAVAQADGTQEAVTGIVYAQASRYAMEVTASVAANLVAGNANRMRFISASGTLIGTGAEL